MTDLAVFLINLDDAPSRLKAAQVALSVQNTQFERVPGVDGRAFDPATIPGYDADGARRYFGRDLNGGEIGAFQSHLRALERFVASGAAYGLILEDDIDPDAGAMDFVRAIIDWQRGRYAQDWYVANLGAKRQKITTDVAVFERGGTEAVLRRAHYFPMLATALLWTRQGAQAFLDHHTAIDCPWDNALRRWLTANDTGLVVSPCLFGTTGASSQIDPAKGAALRSREGRVRTYRLRRMRRQWGDKLRALHHKMRHRPDS